MLPKHFRVAISYSREQSDFVSGVATQLQKHLGEDQVFLDDFYEGPLSKPDLDQRLRQIYHSSDLVAVFISHDYANSRWCANERRVLAELRLKGEGDRIFFARFDAAEIPEISIVDGYTEIGDRTTTDIARVILDALTSPLSPNETLVCPYVGLSPFTEDRSEFFFGRDSVIADLVEAIEKHRVVMTTGPSGSGKSSLIAAGVIPRLRKHNWLPVTFRPQDDLARALADALLPIVDASFASQPTLMRHAQSVSQAEVFRGADSRGTLLDAIVGRILNDSPSIRLLVNIDQLEEIVRRPSAFDSENVLRDLLDLARSVRPPFDRFYFVATFRKDFRLALRRASPSLRRFLGDRAPTFEIPALLPQELHEVIEKPVRMAGGTISDGVSDRLLRDLRGAANDLPLLQFTLEKMWSQGNGRLTHSAYNMVGPVSVALARYAEDVYREVVTGTSADREPTTPEEKQQAHTFERVFLQLVQPGHLGLGQRRSALRSEISSQRWPLVQKLADRSLVVTGTDPVRDEDCAELIHEALIFEWDRLQDWIGDDGNRTFRLWQEELRASLNRSERVELMGSSLEDALRWLDERGSELGALETETIKRSRVL
ncbi:MAG: toll/interleukin-1 receptor domain-containing protein, partial [Planctomycetes bacterium]|nr:toll/interleukin-1 receptor domain-containing protein [Planctomycetota bacterium]